ncbi:hypothetical protein [Sedimentitalea sp.]|uniref:hypothetical protein n=1 Tax=Sedimentitalea sp. TaxID=2048915 RepID=UPI00329906EC
MPHHHHLTDQIVSRAAEVVMAERGRALSAAERARLRGAVESELIVAEIRELMRDHPPATVREIVLSSIPPEEWTPAIGDKMRRLCDEAMGCA